jgi:hypothetical protein
MARHVERLLARSLDEVLTSAEREELHAHLRLCPDCRRTQRDLDRTAELLERGERVATLPRLSAPPSVTASTSPLASALVVGALLVAVIGSYWLTKSREAGDTAAAPSPTAAPSASIGASAARRLVAERRLVLDTGPAGVPTVVTEAFDSFSVVSVSGRTVEHPAVGVAIGKAAFDGRGRVAYWSRESLSAGRYRIVVWEIDSGRDQTLLGPGTDAPAGDLHWSADGRDLIAPVRSASGHARLLRFAGGLSAYTTVSESPIVAEMRVIFADERSIVGASASTYIEIDARTGAIRRQLPRRTQQATDFVASSRGAVAELVRPFESEPGPIHVWVVADPATTLASVDERGVETPVFWPGRSELLFIRGDDILALNTTSGRIRTVLAVPPTPRLIGFDANGDVLLVASGSGGYILLEGAGDTLRPSSPARFTLSRDRFVPIGLID